jgi:hypothetical protein
MLKKHVHNRYVIYIDNPRFLTYIVHSFNKIQIVLHQYII